MTKYKNWFELSNEIFDMLAAQGLKKVIVPGFYFVEIYSLGCVSQFFRTLNSVSVAAS